MAQSNSPAPAKTPAEEITERSASAASYPDAWRAKSPGSGYTFCVTGARLGLTLLTNWRVEGAERIPAQGPLIIVSNHFGFVDPPLVAASIWPRRVNYLAKIEFWEHPVSRFVWDAVGALPIHRGESDRTALRLALDTLRQGGAVGIFPEGTRGRVRPLSLKEARRGVALLARLSGAPILPIGIAGTDALNSGRDLLPQLFRRTPITVRIGQPLELPRYPGLPSSAALSRATEEIMARIASLLPRRYWGFYAGPTEQWLQEHAEAREME